jgi:hypothetical protein
MRSTSIHFARWSYCLCSGWVSFSVARLPAESTNQFISLEIRSGCVDIENWEACGTLPKFGGGFEGLEERLLSTPGLDQETFDVWRSAGGHRSTLKTVVHHRRIRYTNSGTYNSDEDFDVDDLLLMPKSEYDYFKNPSIHPFGCIDWESWRNSASISRTGKGNRTFRVLSDSNQLTCNVLERYRGVLSALPAG